MTVPPEPPVADRRRVAPRAPRIALVVTLAIVFVLVLSLRAIASVITDYAWFDQLGRGDVWSTQLRARLAPAIVSVVATFVVLFVNLTIAERLAPEFRFQGPEDEITHRFRSAVAPFAIRVRIAVATLFALAVGANAAAEWKAWLLFNNAVDFGVRDPQFDKDIGFYVFRLPFINVALGLAFAALAVTFVLTLVSHYLNGGIRFQAPYSRVTPQVKAHLSVLLALMALVKTAQYWFDRCELVLSRRSVRQGALYTDVKVQIPALNLLIIIAVIAAVLFVVNIWQRGWTLPVVSVVSWAFVAVVIGSIVPAATQRYSVENSPLTKERIYIQRNIDATRAAFGIDGLDPESLEIGAIADPDDVAAGNAVLDQVRVWDPEALEGQFNEQQGFRRYYNFNDLDVDRYQFGSDTETVIVGARELAGTLPSDSWLTRHLVYTHGSGLVAASGSDVNRRNASYRLSGIPPTGQQEMDIDADRTGIYFGEGLEPFVIANSKENEVEGTARQGDDDVEVRYAGTGGVEVGGFFNKAALALRFWDRNLFLSSSVTSDSRVIWIRDPRERVEKVAPFLTTDGDAYPVVIDGRVLWVVDGYTTTNRYPYSQSLTIEGSGGLDHPFNFVRNSVKATVDAYDGTVTLYAWDPDDPLLRAWRKVFPDLVDDRSEMSSELEAHLRYPAELFDAQTRRFAEYHVEDADKFYDGNESWQIAQTSTEPIKAETSGGSSTPSTAAANGPDGGDSSRSDVVPDNPAVPLYQMLTMPGETEPEFVLSQSFVPSGRQNVLRAVVYARSDPGHYGELVVAEIDTSVLSPLSAGQRVQNDGEISREISLLQGKGSTLDFGEMRLLPLGKSLLYVQPIFIRGEGDGAFFTLHGVAVSDGESAVLRPTFDESLAALFGDTTEPPPDPGEERTVAELLQLANDEFEAADEAAASGDYEAQGKHLAQAREYVRQALELEGTAGDADPPDGDTPDEESPDGDTADGDTADGDTADVSTTTTSTTISSASLLADA